MAKFFTNFLNQPISIRLNWLKLKESTLILSQITDLISTINFFNSNIIIDDTCSGVE